MPNFGFIGNLMARAASLIIVCTIVTAIGSFTSSALAAAASAWIWDLGFAYVLALTTAEAIHNLPMLLCTPVRRPER